jgi:hypothetical protein
VQHDNPPPGRKAIYSALIFEQFQHVLAASTEEAGFWTVTSHPRNEHMAITLYATSRPPPSTINLQLPAIRLTFRNARR